MTSPPETIADYYERRRKERRSQRRHAAIIAFCTGMIGGAVGAILTVAVAAWLR